MSATIQLSLLTNLLLDTLRTSTMPDSSPIAVGDMVIPADVGWSSEPNYPGSSFTPYGILVPMQATQSTGSFGRPQSDWQIPHVVQSYGADREQCQYVGDRLRDALVALRNQIVTLEIEYKVQQVWTDVLGAPTRVPGTDPAYYGAQDQITVWLTRR